MARRHDVELAGALEDLGLSPTEAAAYLALLGLGNVGARELVEATSIKRSSIYAVLRTLQERGLVEGGAGYGSRFRPVPPERALPSLIDHERAELTDALARKEKLAKELAGALAELARGAGDYGAGELIEVIRNPRAVSERYARLQLQANNEISVFNKAPMVQTGPNPEQSDALRRGVRVRGLYEQAVLADEAVRPHLRRWIEEGEDVRVYPGELPFKLALIDSHMALMPLDTPEGHRDVTSILVRNRGLGCGLAMLFDRLWDEAAPIKGFDGAE